MDLMIEKGKKQEWLKENGGDLALQLLGDQVSKSHNIATENNLRNKDVSETESTTSNEIVEIEQELVNENKTFEVDENDSNVETSDENVLVENTDTNNESDNTEDESVNTSSVKSFVIDNPQEFINLLFVEVIEPLRNEVKELKSEIENLKKDFSDNTKSIKSASINLEVVPTSSLAALLKAKMNDGNSNDFSEPVTANDPLLAQKPKEMVVDESNNTQGAFANFMTGF